MEKLIKEWEKLAEKYEVRAREIENEFTVERLLASAETLKVCADQLKRFISDPSNLRLEKHGEI